MKVETSGSVTIGERTVGGDALEAVVAPVEENAANERLDVIAFALLAWRSSRQRKRTRPTFALARRHTASSGPSSRRTLGAEPKSPGNRAAARQTYSPREYLPNLMAAWTWDCCMIGDRLGTLRSPTMKRRGRSAPSVLSAMRWSPEQGLAPDIQTLVPRGPTRRTLDLHPAPAGSFNRIANDANLRGDHLLG